MGQTSLLFWWQSCWADLKDDFSLHMETEDEANVDYKKKAEMTNRNREKHNLSSTDGMP